MKIGLLLPGLEGGGVEKRFLNLAAAFTNRGHSVYLFIMFERGLFFSLVPQNVQVVMLKGNTVWQKIIPLANYLKKQNLDAILSAKAHVNIVALAARDLASSSIRVVVSEIDSKSPLFGNARRTKFLHVFRDTLTRWLYRRADAVIGNSFGVVEQIGNVPGLRQHRVFLIYNGIDVPLISSMKKEAIENFWLHEEDGVPLIVGSGRLVPQKDFATLIHAFDRVQRHRPARLLILGEGPERGALELLIDQLALRGLVRLPGFFINPYTYMGRADVFVLSSRHEGFPNVLLEALACGTPVVSTDCPAGPKEILEGGRYGPLVPVGDPEALAEAILTTLDSPLPREVLKARAEVFSLDAMADAYLRVLSGEKP